MSFLSGTHAHLLLDFLVKPQTGFLQLVNLLAYLLREDALNFLRFMTDFGADVEELDEGEDDLLEDHDDDQVCLKFSEVLIVEDVEHVADVVVDELEHVYLVDHRVLKISRVLVILSQD